MTSDIVLPKTRLETAQAILKQSWPTLISAWAGIAFGVLDTIMTGHASANDLATMALSVSIYITVFVGLMGVMHALIPILAQYYGANDLDRIGHSWGQGIWVALGLSALGGAVMMFPDLWLSFSGDVAPEVRTSMNHYLSALTVALPGSLIFRTIYSLANAVSRPKLVMMINLLGIVLKVIFNWLLIFGNWGLPALGAAGAGVSTCIVNWISLAVGMLVISRTPFYRAFNLRFDKPDWSEIGAILKLGIPMGGSYFVEVCAFTFMSLLIAKEGTAVIGGHQIMSNLAALSYMMPMSIGVTTAALSAQALGAKAYEHAHRTSMMGLFICLTGSLMTALLLYFERISIVGIYTDKPEVATVALALLTILPWFHVIDAMQCINSYMLRAHKIAVVPMLLQTFALLFVGLIGGWWLGFGPAADWFEPKITRLVTGAPTGAASMWLMAALGLGISAALLHTFYRHIVRRERREHLAI